MNFDDYKNTLSYPRKADFSSRFYYKGGKVVAKIGPNEDLPSNVSYSVCENALDEEGYKKAQQMYSDNGTKLAEKFVTDLFDEFGLPDNEFTRKLYAIAHREGHSNGYSEIYNCFEDLVVLDELAKKVYGK